MSCGSRSKWIGHFLYENWKNPYTSSEEAVKDNCNNQIGCISWLLIMKILLQLQHIIKKIIQLKITNDIKTD